MSDTDDFYTRTARYADAAIREGRGKAGASWAPGRVCLDTAEEPAISEAQIPLKMADHGTCRAPAAAGINNNRSGRDIGRTQVRGVIIKYITAEK
jgi:hypothetical protein